MGYLVMKALENGARKLKEIAKKVISVLHFYLAIQRCFLTDIVEFVIA